MESIYKADIFFFITAVAVIFITALLVVAFLYIIKILRTLSNISEMIREEGELFRGDIQEFRKGIHQRGMRLKYLLDFVRNRFIARAKGRSGKSRANKGV